MDRGAAADSAPLVAASGGGAAAGASGGWVVDVGQGGGVGSASYREVGPDPRDGVVAAGGWAVAVPGDADGGAYRVGYGDLSADSEGGVGLGGAERVGGSEVERQGSDSGG